MVRVRKLWSLAFYQKTVGGESLIDRIASFYLRKKNGFDASVQYHWRWGSRGCDHFSAQQFSNSSWANDQCAHHGIRTRLNFTIIRPARWDIAKNTWLLGLQHNCSSSSCKHITNVKTILCSFLFSQIIIPNIPIQWNEFYLHNSTDNHLKFQTIVTGVPSNGRYLWVQIELDFSTITNSNAESVP